MGKFHIAFQMLFVYDFRYTGSPVGGSLCGIGNFHMNFTVAHGIEKFEENQSIRSFMCIYIHSGFGESWENYNHRIKVWMRYQIREQIPITLQQLFTRFSKQTFNLNSKRKVGVKFSQRKKNFWGLFQLDFLGKKTLHTKTILTVNCEILSHITSKLLSYFVSI